jgi:hypothetical protein
MSIIKKLGLTVLLAFVASLTVVFVVSLFPQPMNIGVKELKADTKSVNYLLWAANAAVYSNPDNAMGQVGANAIVAITDPSPSNAHKYSKITVTNPDNDGNLCVYWTAIGGECSGTSTHYCSGEAEDQVGALVAHGNPPREWIVANNRRTCLFASSTPTSFHVERLKAE